MTEAAAKNKEKKAPIKFTKTSVEALPIPTTESRFYYDSALKGFTLRVWSNGAKVYMVEEWMSSEQRTVKVRIGKHGQITTEQARKMAGAKLAEMAAGVNPIKKKKAVAEQVKADKVKSATLETAWADYKAAKNLGARTIYENDGTMRRCFSDWMSRPVASINTEMVCERYKRLSEHKGPRSNDDGAKASADRAMRVLRAIFNHLISSY